MSLCVSWSPPGLVSVYLHPVLFPPSFIPFSLLHLLPLFLAPCWLLHQSGRPVLCLTHEGDSSGCGGLGAAGVESSCLLLHPRLLVLLPAELPGPRLTHGASPQEQPSFSASGSESWQQRGVCRGPAEPFEQECRPRTNPMALQNAKVGSQDGLPAKCGIHNPEHGRQTIMKRHMIPPNDLAEAAQLRSSSVLLAGAGAGQRGDPERPIMYILK